MLRVAATVAFAVIVLTGCTTDTSDTTAPATTPPPSTTSTITTQAPTTTAGSTTLAPSATTTTPPTSTTKVRPATTATTTRPATTTSGITYSIAAHGLHPDALAGSGGWLGSGCSPGCDSLPAGIWWGYVAGLSPSSITFDLACLGWADESDDDPASEDYGWVIANSNPKVRVVPVRSDARVTDRWGNTPPQPSLPFAEWIEGDRLPHEDQGREDGLWLYVNNGAVTEVGVEMFAG